MLNFAHYLIIGEINKLLPNYFHNFSSTFSLYLFSHENLEHFGECKNETKDEEEAEVELCLNEQPSNVNEANVIGTLKSGWPACQGTLTLTNSNSEEKVYVARLRKLIIAILLWVLRSVYKFIF